MSKDTELILLQEKNITELEAKVKAFKIINALLIVGLGIMLYWRFFR